MPISLSNLASPRGGCDPSISRGVWSLLHDFDENITCVRLWELMETITHFQSIFTDHLLSLMSYHLRSALLNPLRTKNILFHRSNATLCHPSCSTAAICRLSFTDIASYNSKARVLVNSQKFVSELPKDLYHFQAQRQGTTSHHTDLKSRICLH